jgi:DUF4097 and DUF4098 domain-containing protein YvlB
MQNTSPIAPNRRLASFLAFAALLFLFSGCNMGPAVSGSFDRSLDVTGPLRLELANVAGDIHVTGAEDGKVHIHGDVRVSGFGFGNPQERLNQITSNPPIELRGDTLRIGKDYTGHHVSNVTIAYTVEVPRNSEVASSSVSGALNIRNVRGPLQANSVSGSVEARDIGRDAKLASVSGSIDVENCGDDVRASSVSGSVTVVNAKGDVIAHSVSGSVTVRGPGGRVDSNSVSGSVAIHGANNDVKAHTASGTVDIGGNPSGNSYWDLNTASGSINIAVPPDANFHLSSTADSGQIRAQIPIVIEEQGKHSLRARMGNGNGRVEVHTRSGSIELDGGK